MLANQVQTAIVESVQLSAQSLPRTSKLPTFQYFSVISYFHNNTTENIYPFCGKYNTEKLANCGAPFSSIFYCVVFTFILNNVARIKPDPHNSHLSTTG